MESLTLSRFPLDFLLRPDHRLWQATACGLLGAHHDMSATRLKNGSPRNRMAEMVGEWVDGVIATRADQTKSRFQPARDDRKGRLRQRLAIRSHIGQKITVEVAGRWCDYRMFFSWRQRRRGTAFHLCLRRPHPDRAPQRHPRPAGRSTKRCGSATSIWDRRGPADVPPRHPAARHRGPDARAINDLVEVAISESERFYPAFQYVVWAGKTPANALRLNSRTGWANLVRKRPAAKKDHPTPPLVKT